MKKKPIEREFYRLPDLADRWGCSVADLLHLGIQNQAQICACIYGMAASTTRTLKDAEVDYSYGDEELKRHLDSIPDFVGPPTEVEHIEGTRLDEEWETWRSRTSVNMPHGVFEIGLDDLRFLEMPGQQQHELHVALKFDEGTWWTVEFDPPVVFNQSHLCIRHEEVQRLDRDLFGADPVLNKKAETTYLNIIGGLLDALLGATPSGVRQSVFESQASIIESMLAHHGAAPGISRTTLEAKFAEAKRSLRAV